WSTSSSWTSCRCWSARGRACCRTAPRPASRCSSSAPSPRAGSTSGTPSPAPPSVAAVPKRNAASPRISPVVLPELQEGDAGTLLRGGRLDGLRIADVDASGAELTGAVVDECLLQTVVLDDGV